MFRSRNWLFPVLLALGAQRANAGAGNDDCTSAQVVTSGSVVATCSDSCGQPGGGCTTDADWYRITVPAGAELVVALRDVVITGAPGYPFAILHDGSGPCPGGGVTGTGWTLDGDFNSNWFNTTGVARDVTVLVHVQTSGETTTSTMSYRLVTNVSASPCLAQTNDALAPNQNPSQGHALTDGVYPNLFVRYTQPDAFRVLVPALGSFTATATFTSSLGDVDLRTWDVPGPVASTGTGDVESITWTNPDGFARLATFVAHVKFGHYDACNTYQLALDVAGAYGVEYCPASANSQGIGASLSLNSSPSASASSWTWWSFGTRPNSSILLYCGDQQTSVPFGDGQRCVAGSLFRLRTTVAGTSGFVQIAISAANLPPALHFLPGSTWNFQTRYRDNGGPLGSGFNFSNGVAVTFTP